MVKYIKIINWGSKMIEQLKDNFYKLFGKTEVEIYFAPGRVNLIGEHTDYNGGHVFPCAIDKGTYLLSHKRDDHLIQFYSENFRDHGIIKIDLSHLIYDINDDWANYPKSVFKVLMNAGYIIDQGFDLYFYGNIPNGAGLSSSASIELVTAVMLDDQFEFKLSHIALAKYCQKAENQFIGVNCGIMDQFAIGMGKENHAVLLNTSTLQYQYAPLNLSDYNIIVTNTNKRRSLADSKYNERRGECEKALKLLQESVNILSLGDLSTEEYDEISYIIKDKVIQRRAKHAVYENQRTLQAKTALENEDLVMFGQLMNESHISLRDDYEASGPELDTLVSLAWKEQGVIGSRMTGAGFGGCTVSIVQKKFTEQFKANIENVYEKLIGYKPSFYLINVADGARKLT